MFGPDDEETQKGIEEKHNEWIKQTNTIID
jgi:hypothetical protein